MTYRELIAQPATPHGASDQPAILLVDDEQPILDMLQDALDDEGFLVVTATNGQAALRIAAETPLALVLTDLMMPQMDGATLCQQLRSNPRTRAIPILLMTAARQSFNAQLFNAVIAKPFNLADLIELVHRYANQI